MGAWAVFMTAILLVDVDAKPMQHGSGASSSTKLPQATSYIWTLATYRH